MNPKPITFDDWLALPKLEIKPIASEKQYASLFTVSALTVLLLPVADRNAKAVEGFPVIGSQHVLAAAALSDSEGPSTWYRLPAGLSEWAKVTLSMPVDLFPCNVEFGLLRDRYYAQFL